MNCKQAVLSDAQKCRQTHGCLASPLCSRRLITHGQIHEFTGKWAGPQAMLPVALPRPWHNIPQQVLARRNRRSGRTGCPRRPVYLAPLRRLNRTASDVPVAPERWPEFRLLVKKCKTRPRYWWHGRVRFQKLRRAATGLSTLISADPARHWPQIAKCQS